MHFRGLSVALLAALVAAAPAQAASSTAPGLAKKNPTTTAGVAPAPAPNPLTQVAPTQTAHAPTATATPQSTSSQGSSTTHAATPLTKGTAKKITATAAPVTTTAPVTTGTTTHQAAPRHRMSATRRAARRSTTARSRFTQSYAAQTAAASRAIRAHEPASPATAHARAVEQARRAQRQRARAAHRPAPVAKTSRQDQAPLASISRAADHVIEVIPGALILALVGLGALVFLLIVRSWAMERTRSRALAQSYGITVEALATAIEAKDHTTGGHIERVRRLGLLLAAEVAPREARDPQMAYGFLLHDIGKLAVPDAILRAPGRLSEEQWSLMRRHPDEGARMLATIPFLDRALDVVRHHHERWDGGGYPAGLSGTEIPLWARIFAVVDALDAITADRPYRPGRSYAAALDEIRRHSGSQFDPDVVEALERLDPRVVEPLLEPTQLMADEPAAEPGGEVVELGPLVAA